jgi:hypothetical protein
MTTPTTPCRYCGYEGEICVEIYGDTCSVCGNKLNFVDEQIKKLQNNEPLELIKLFVTISQLAGLNNYQIIKLFKENPLYKEYRIIE